jgi:hypothetical protein
MTPYRTAARLPPDEVDVDVRHFAARSRRARRVQGSAALATVALVVFACIAPVVFSAQGRGTLASTPMSAIAPFDSTPRRMPLVYALVRAPCPPMEDAERVRFEQTNRVECSDGCLWYPDRSSWR